MGERKVLNKYYPPSFDPKKLPRLRKPTNHQKKIRFMLPVRVRCNTCGNYMSEGTKFNSREEVTGEMYLVVKIHRFYIKCTKCSAEITIKTDSKNEGYAVESGATCPRGNIGHKEEEEKHKGPENALESLERRSIASKREIEVMTALDEMKSMKSRRASVSVDAMLEALSKRQKQEEEVIREEEEMLIKSIKFGKRTRNIDEDLRTDEEEKKKKPKTTKRRDCSKSKTKRRDCSV